MMTLVGYKQLAVDRRVCPRCNAEPRQPCCSTFLKREMVNDVHRGRIVSQDRRDART